MLCRVQLRNVGPRSCKVQVREGRQGIRRHDPPGDPDEPALLREDLAYHQARILLLVDAVTAAHGHQGKVDGLTKLAKLDFLLYYPGAAARRAAP
jgi:hypothetical protein